MIRFNDMPTERHRELSSKGGIASGEARRRKKAMQTRFTDIFATQAAMLNLGDEFEEFLIWKSRKEIHAKQWREFQLWRRREARLKREAT